ncbi:unnamed protein product [Rotaria sp. Silwood2]|nr:unnamed protein product [Rotaria sp. Silwood2]
MVQHNQSADYRRMRICFEIVDRPMDDNCPNLNGTVTSITKDIFDVTQSNQCELHDANNHWIIETVPIFTCRQSYTYFYTGNQVVTSCSNKIGVYQYVEYQCIPTNTELVAPNVSCPLDCSKNSNTN